MQKQFKYIYNNEEVSREDFEKLAGDSFKWFDGDSVVSVPFSSFDSFFTGDFKSRRQINDHLDSVLNVYQNKVTEDIINKPKCSPQCYCDGSCKKPQQKSLGGYKIPNVKVNATRHKAREEGKFHKENEDIIKIISYNKEDVQERGWVGKNGTKFRVKTNKILKPLNVITINELWGLYLIVEEVNGYDCTLKIINSENDEYIQYPCELLNAKPDYHIISNSYTKEYISKIKNKISAKKEQKDDVITNSNRGEKETMEYLQGVKETEGKVNYGELDFDYVDSMALRMSKNLEKYPPKNWQKNMDIEELAKSAIRHARKILQQIKNDEETLEEHAIALGCNGMMINYQLKVK